MKKIVLLTFLSILGFNLAIAQAPSGYYYGTSGLTGASLKTKLSQIITNGHQAHGYNSLWSAYQTTDIDGQYEGDNTILDYYSENPNGTDPYNYTPGNNQCGNYSGEGSCYNREHIVPQSFFGSASPMKTDIHHVRATDGYVNGRRGHFPFGETNNASWTSQNGSKVGTSSSPGYGGTIFEPIDEFKGDIARMVFYFITRYENNLSQFYGNGAASTMLGSTAYPGLQQWELQVLLAWHNADPVSPYEIARNNASYAYQNNRNPYIDNPNWVNAVWNPTPDTTNPTAPTNLVAGNPTSTSIDINWTASTDNVGVSLYEIYVDNVLNSTVSGSTITKTISGLSPSTTYSFYVRAKDAAGNYSSNSNTTSETTLAQGTGGNPTGTTCGTEDFENMPASSSSYTTRTWTNNNITWTATESRTDQTINNRALTLNRNESATLTSSTISGGISSLTLTAQRVYSGGSGNLTVEINGNAAGVIPYDSNTTTTTINTINVQGNFTITITNDTGDRVAIDDLSWTCYSTMGTTEIEDNTSINFFPNPVREGKIYYANNKVNSPEWIKIYSISGRLIKSIDQPFVKKNWLDVSMLSKGVYIFQTPKSTSKIIVE